MYRTVVVPLDLTGEAETAITHGATVARQTGATLELLTVTSSYGDIETVRRHLDETAEQYGVLVTIRATAHGDPSATILDEASSADTLICLRTHARRPLGELALGSVSEQVMRSCPHPVLLIGPRCGPAPERYESMIVALDGSALAGQILPTVAGWASELDLTPWLFQVFPALMPLDVGSDDFYETGYVHQQAQRLADEDDVKAEWDTIHHGKPASAIVQFAQAHQPSLVALTTRGRSGYGRLVMGSTALEVAHRATVPVLVARPPDPR